MTPVDYAPVLPLPDGATLHDDGTTTVLCIPGAGVVGNMGALERWTLIGMRNLRDVHECLLAMLPRYGVAYPATEQLSFLLEGER